MVTLPGTRLESVARLREWLAAHLAGAHHDLYAIQVCASELAANAILHSASGLGSYDVWVGWSDCSVRVVVFDAGPSPTKPDPNRDGGRGLQVVAGLASACGFYDTPSGCRAAWFELTTTP
jgi:anti-sigma regulatory factor (Ser/Thr protein kinase)